jgi:hypothetical protein
MPYVVTLEEAMGTGSLIGQTFKGNFMSTGSSTLVQNSFYSIDTTTGAIISIGSRLAPDDASERAASTEQSALTFIYCTNNGHNCGWPP